MRSEVEPCSDGAVSPCRSGSHPRTTTGKREAERVAEVRRVIGILHKWGIHTLGQFASGVEMRVLADAGENIEHLTSARRRVLHPVRRDDGKTKMLREMDEFSVGALFAAHEVPLDFDIDILVA